MSTEFKLPEIGEGTAEGEIIKWLVSEGDQVAEDTPLVEVMTDKATVEIPSPRAGTVLELRAAEGEVVEVGAVIMRIGEPGAEEAPATPAAAPPAPERAADSVEDPLAAARAMARAELADGDAEADAAAAPGEAAAPAAPWEVPAATGRVLTTPATRRLARDLGVDLSVVPGSGRGGRVVKEDVLAFAEGSLAPKMPAAAPVETPPVEVVSEPAPVEAADEPRAVSAAAPASPASPAAAASPVPPAGGAREERIPIRGLRRRIAERLVAAKRTIPHFTYVEECDMTEIVALRERAKEAGAAHGVRVTYLPFIVKALIEACRRHPIVNSALDEAAGEIVVKRYYNVGIATDTDRGLVVPVVKDADRLSIFDLAREIDRLAAEAREGRSQLEDLQGGTITITSTGNIGGVMATPIINHPEVAILGVTAIRKRPVVRDDAIVARHMVNLSLSLDHRVVDGAPGALFMRDLVRLLEDPKQQILGTP